MVRLRVENNVILTICRCARGLWTLTYGTASVKNKEVIMEAGKKSISNLNCFVFGYHKKRSTKNAHYLDKLGNRFGWTEIVNAVLAWVINLINE